MCRNARSLRLWVMENSPEFTGTWCSCLYLRLLFVVVASSSLVRRTSHARMPGCRSTFSFNDAYAYDGFTAFHSVLSRTIEEI